MRFFIPITLVLKWFIFVNHLILVMVVVDPEPIPGKLGLSWECTLDGIRIEPGTLELWGSPAAPLCHAYAICLVNYATYNEWLLQDY